MLSLPRLLSRPMGLAHPFAQRRYLSTATRYRPLLYRAAIVDSRRARSTEAGDDKSGHIDARENEGVFFLDSMSNKALIILCICL